ELLALAEQELIAEADAEERPLALEAGAERRDQAEALETPHRVVEGPVTGQHDRLRVVDHLRVLGHDGRHAHPAEGLLDAAEIAPPVIHDRDHVSGPGCRDRLDAPMSAEGAKRPSRGPCSSTRARSEREASGGPERRPMLLLFTSCLS